MKTDTPKPPAGTSVPRSGEAPHGCTAAGAPASELWTPADEREIARSFAATGAPFASDAAAALGRSITAWRTRWQRTAVESCEATRVQGVQSAATLDLRTACLLRARDQLRITLAALGHTDRPGVEAAANLALPDLDACNDVAALAGATPPPRDPSQQLTLAHALGDKHPGVAQLQYNLGVVAHRQGHYAEALERYRAALAGREAAYGRDSVDYAMTILAIGNAELMEDRVADARAHLEQAIHLLEARLGPEHPDAATAYNDLGATLHRAGLYQLALANTQHVLALREKALGPEHPDVAQSLVNLAIDAKNLAQWDVVDPSYRTAGPGYAKRLAAIETWLASHR